MIGFLFNLQLLLKSSLKFILILAMCLCSGILEAEPNIAVRTG
jgi:hypothetical protein